jgi:uncharacterized SAM-binding protein YcdF (DUF218 family)
LAFFVGAFSLLNILGELRYPGFDANLWWIDFRPILPAVSRTFLGVCSALLIAYAILPRMSIMRRFCTLLTTGIILGVTALNAANFYILLGIGKITAGFPIAFSLFVAAALAVILTACIRKSSGETGKRGRFGLVVVILTVGACLFGFPLAQMYCFGKTDYKRTADAIVVFGARVYADGRVSDALADRLRTGARLYLDGFAPKIIMSGGPGDGEIHESEGMKRMAVELGVPGEAVLRDADGLNTQATIENTCEMFEQMGLRRVLVVSHFYHLPRIKMTYQRRGWDVYTVPAKESYTLTQMPMYILREIAALWVYYLRPILP